MDFLTLNFGQLLHLLDNELKNIIRTFENQKKQIISAQYGIHIFFPTLKKINRSPLSLLGN